MASHGQKNVNSIVLDLGMCSCLRVLESYSYAVKCYYWRYVFTNSCVKTCVLSFENHSQNVPLLTTKLHYHTIFQPAIPKTWQECFYTTVLCRYYLIKTSLNDFFVRKNSITFRSPHAKTFRSEKKVDWVILSLRDNGLERHMFRFDLLEGLGAIGLDILKYIVVYKELS